MRRTLVFVLTASLSVAILAQENGKAETWQRQPTLSDQFQGRWAILDNKGQISKDACKKEGVPSADLVVGPTWFVHKSGSGFLIEIEKSGYRNARYNVVDNGGGEVGVTFELMTLGEDSNTLEIASSPEMGWEIMRYKRCPANA
jgi:hypothetical protein